MASPVNMTETEAEASIEKSLRRIFESQKAKLGILYQVNDAEPPSPEYEEAVKDIAESLGVATTGGRRYKNKKTLKRRATRRTFTKRR